MIRGHCHCGAVSWELDATPPDATACNCSICRRYGTLWAYDWQDEGIAVNGDTTAYVWGDKEIGFHFCPTCGCLGYWRAIAPDAQGRRRIAVNLRLAEDPGDVMAVPIRHFDGLDSWTDRPDDGRCVKDMWF
jgi:hypothetical protein